MKTCAKFLDSRIDCQCRKARGKRNHYCIAEVGQHYDEGKYPKWFKKILMKKWNALSVNSDSLYKDYPFSNRWFDHAGVLEDGGVEVLIIEPYDLSAMEISEILKFARDLNLGFAMSATSSHFPTRTIRIGFLPADV